MQWSRKEQLRGKVGLFQEGSAMGREKQGKSKGINRKGENASRKTDKEGEVLQLYIYVYTCTSISFFDTDFLWDLRKGMTFSCAHVK